MAESVECLGHVIDAKGLHPTETKVLATGMIGAAHLENVTGDMTPSAFNLSSLSSTLDLRVNGSGLGLKNKAVSLDQFQY